MSILLALIQMIKSVATWITTMCVRIKTCVFTTVCKTWFGKKYKQAREAKEIVDLANNLRLNNSLTGNQAEKLNQTIRLNLVKTRYNTTYQTYFGLFTIMCYIIKVWMDINKNVKYSDDEAKENRNKENNEVHRSS